MKINEMIKLLQRQLASGIKPVAEFKAGIEDKEDYAESGMRGTVVSLKMPRNADDVFEIFFCYEDFAAHNSSFEKSNYYDKDHKPTLNARQAGMYKPTDHMYFGGDEDCDDLFTLIESKSGDLFAEYSASGSKLSYVGWLEETVLSLR